MTSGYEQFWTHDRYAVVGHSARKGFPKLTYRGLKDAGKTVHAVDPSVTQVDGDPTHPDLGSLPGPVDAVVLEVPKKETREWMEKVIEAGIDNVWIHQFSDTPEALALARERRMNVLSGNCAVMYLTRGPSIHGLHRRLSKAIGAY